MYIYYARENGDFRLISPEKSSGMSRCFVYKLIFCDETLTVTRKKFDKNAKKFDKPIAF
jgi:hypothetical protein